MNAPIVEENPAYKLTPLQRRIVGTLAVWRLWPNTAIGRAYGVNPSVVSRHGARMRALLPSCCPHPEDDL